MRAVPHTYIDASGGHAKWQSRRWNVLFHMYRSHFFYSVLWLSIYRGLEPRAGRDCTLVFPKYPGIVPGVAFFPGSPDIHRSYIRSIPLALYTFHRTDPLNVLAKSPPRSSGARGMCNYPLSPLEQMNGSIYIVDSVYVWSR